MRTIRKAAAAALLFAALLSSVSITGAAVESVSEQQVSPAALKGVTEGGEFTLSHSGKGENYRAEASFHTFDLDAGYYSTYLYEYKKYDISGCDAFALGFENNSEEELRINVNLQTGGDGNVQAADEQPVVLENRDGTAGELVKAMYGSITVPAGFDGTVYVPFASMADESGEPFVPGTIRSWGITVILEEDRSAQYAVKNIRFLSDSIAFQKEQYYTVHLLGTDTVHMTEEETTETRFRAEVKDMDGQSAEKDVRFSLKEPVPGAEVTEAGMLRIQAGCRASYIDLLMRVEDAKSVSSHRIGLTFGKEDGVPATSQIPPLSKGSYEWLAARAALFRAAGSAAAGGADLLFLSWLAMAKRSYKVIQFHVPEREEDGEKE